MQTDGQGNFSMSSVNIRIHVKLGNSFVVIYRNLNEQIIGYYTFKNEELRIWKDEVMIAFR
jgi:hypothetical protein